MGEHIQKGGDGIPWDEFDPEFWSFGMSEETSWALLIFSNINSRVGYQKHLKKEKQIFVAQKHLLLKTYTTADCPNAL